MEAFSTVERTNSGDSSFDRFDRKATFHGAGPFSALPDVVDMVRRRLVRRDLTRNEAMVKVLMG